jgi:hypothetical protein
MPELMVFKQQLTYTELDLLKLATTNAFYAVGVGSAYGVLNYCVSKEIVLQMNTLVKFN